VNKDFSFDYKNKTVLITGAARGLGAGIAREYARAGANTIINYRRAKTEAEDLVKELNRFGSSLAIQADVSKKTEVDKLIKKVKTHFSKIDILINNAGIYPQNSILDMPEESWDAVINANLKTAFLVSQAVAQEMIANNTEGNIINISTIEAWQPAKMHSHYSSSKAALNMFSRAAANELAEYNIRVNSISAGLIWRPGIEDDWPDGVLSWKKAAPLGELVTANDIANACLFLSSGAARMISGQDIKIDAGVSTRAYF